MTNTLAKLFLFFVLLATFGCERGGDLMTIRKRLLPENDEPVQKDQNAGVAATAHVAVERVTLARHIEALKSVCSQELKDLDLQYNKLIADRAELSKKVQEITAQEKSRHILLNEILKDPTVNALALKYLGTDFSLVRITFTEQVKEVMSLEQHQEKAMRENERRYRAKLKDAEEDEAASASEVKFSIQRIQRQIETLERKQHTLQNRLSLANALQRKQLQQELQDISNSLRNMRSQYNAMRSTEQQNNMHAQLVQRRNSRDSNALAEKRQADAQIKNMARTSADIASEYEGRTIKTLNMRLAEAISQKVERLGAVRRINAYLCAIKVDGISAAGLKQLREDVDRSMESVRRQGEPCLKK